MVLSKETKESKNIHHFIHMVKPITNFVDLYL